MRLIRHVILRVSVNLNAIGFHHARQSVEIVVEWLKVLDS
jgi:hypothetical protein